MGKSLTDKKLVLSLSLNDPYVQKITSLQQTVEYFIKSSIPTRQLCKYLESTQGSDVIFIIDGFGELNNESPCRVFFAKLIRGEVLSHATMVITSRPFTLGYYYHGRYPNRSQKAIFHFYSNVEEVVEILGFEQSSINKYAAEILESLPLNLDNLQKHLQQYPHINAMCHNPAIMSLMVFICMCQPNDLPSTATKLYTTFVLCSVVHHLRKLGKISDDTNITTLKDIPEQTVHKSLQHLEKLSFDALMRDELMFTTKELAEDDPSCYGLLQCTESSITGNVSSPLFRFLCYGIQECFAAKYVSNLPDYIVYKLLSESFLAGTHRHYDAEDDSNSYLFHMWILYCGIVGELYHQKVPMIIQDFLSSFIANNEDLHWQMYDLQQILQEDISPLKYSVLPTEHKDLDPSSLKYSSMTQQKMSPIEHKDVDPSSLKYSSMTQQKIKHEHEDLSSLLKYPFMTQPLKHRHDEDIDATTCALYLFQCFKEAQHENFYEAISASLRHGYIGDHWRWLLPHQVASLGFFLVNSTHQKHNFYVNKCHIGDRGICILHQYICADKTRKYDIDTIDLCHNDLTDVSSSLIADIVRNTEPHKLDLSRNNINELNNVIMAMAATNTVKVFVIRSNNITAQSAKALTDILTSLELLNISSNNLGDDGAIIMSKGIAITNTLKMLDISNNNIGSTGFVAITNALVNNTSLEELMMNENIIGEDDTQIVITVTESNHTLKTFCGDHNKIGLLGLEAIAKTFFSLEELRLNHNAIGQDGAPAIATLIANNSTLRKLSIRNNDFGSLGTVMIVNALASNTSLEKLNMSENSIGQDGAKAFASVIPNNKTLQTLILASDDTINEERAMLIIRSLHYNSTITCLDLYDYNNCYKEVEEEVDKINIERRKVNVQKVNVHYKTAKKD